MYQPQHLTQTDIHTLEAQFYEAMPNGWKEFALCFYGCLLGLKIQGLTLEKAAEIAIALAESFAIDFGGLSLYVQTGKSILAKQNYAKIQAEFNGKNHRKLATKFGLTEIRIRQIVNPSLKK